MPMDPWVTNNFVDSCACDPKYSPEDEAAREIFKLHEEQSLAIVIAHSTQKEIEHPNTPGWVKQQASCLVFTYQTSLNSNERALLKKIHKILSGEGKPENVEQDAKHVFEAAKYGSYFVTTDDRLLKKAQEIRQDCIVEIIRPSKFLKVVCNYDPT